jgi:hypothetical protein
MTQMSGPIPAGSPDVTMIRGTYTSSLEKVACGAFSDISFVSAGKKRRFCQLRSSENASRQVPRLPTF